MLLNPGRKQHLIVFTPNGGILCKEYLCDCHSSLSLDSHNCDNDETEYNQEASKANDNIEEEKLDEEVDQNQQIFDFVEVPSFISLFTGSRVEPLYFVKVIEK